MAYSITQDTSAAGPLGVYNPNYVTLFDDSATEVYFEVDVSFNGLLKELVLFPGSDDLAYLDVNKLIQDSFKSDVNEIDLNVFPYKVYGRGYHDNVLNWSDQTDVSSWVLNGTKDNYDFNLINTTNNTYLSDYNSEPLFLNEQTTNYVYYDASLSDLIGDAANNELILYLLTGTYRGNTNSGSTSSAESLLEVIAYRDGVESDDTFAISEAGNGIAGVPIGPEDINDQLGAGFIDEDVDYYTVGDASSNAALMYVHLKDVNLLNDRYFRFSWINKNGVLNFYNFDYNYSKSLNIKKSIYEKMSGTLNQELAAYNTTASEIYNITTGWIKEEDSVVLEGLWVSPSVKVSALYTKQSDYNKYFINKKLISNEKVILDIKSIEIKRRRNTKLINYSIDFVISDNYITHKH